MRESLALLDSTNALDWRGSGGDHRSMQLAELLQSAGLEVRVPPRTATTTFLERHLLGLSLGLDRGYPIHLHDGERTAAHGRRAISNAGHLAKRYTGLLAEKPRIFVWENSGNTTGASLAARAGCPIFAVPANVYTLERGFRDDWLGRRGLAALERELAFLHRCAGVSTISREEQWMLRLQGIDADHLPYYPPRELEAFLLEVRRMRQPSPECRVLLLGSAFHPPTGKSLEEQIRLLSGFGLRIDVAGYGTESLRPAAASPGVVVHGSVTMDQLRELMLAASMAVVHQRPSVGALTKIVDLILAGVPVIANVDASRSTWGMHGVAHYDSVEELEELIRKPMPAPPLPERPVLAEARFRQTVRKLAG